MADGSAGGGVSADGKPGGTTLAAASPLPQAQTVEERRAALDKQLSDSLGTFDERLRKEQQKTAEERDARQATVSAAAAASAAKAGTDPAVDAAGTATAEVPDKPSDSRQSRTSKRGDNRSINGGDFKSDKSGDTNGSATGNGALGNVIPDGNDDDIVARRLRKAAEQETDPELQEKLWKEYVEYKKNAQVH